MKVYYFKKTIKKDFMRTFEESLKMMNENPERYCPETAEIDIKLEAVDIPENLIEKFKEDFKEQIEQKKPLQENEIMGFFDRNK